MTEKDFENNNSSGLIFRRKLRTSDEMILEPTGSRLIPEMDRKRCFPDHNPKIMNFKSTIHQLFFFFFFPSSIFQAGFFLQCLVQVKYAKNIIKTTKPKMMQQLPLAYGLSSIPTFSYKTAATLVTQPLCHRE